MKLAVTKISIFLATIQGKLNVIGLNLKKTTGYFGAWTEKKFKAAFLWVA